MNTEPMKWGSGTTISNVLERLRASLRLTCGDKRVRRFRLLKRIGRRTLSLCRRDLHNLNPVPRFWQASLNRGNTVA